MSLSRRYARALLSISEQSSCVEPTAQSIEALSQAFVDTPELSGVLRNPMFPHAKRRGVLLGVLDGVQAPESLKVFVGFLFDRDRLSILPELARVYRQLADEAAGILRGEVVSASRLEREQVSTLEEMFAKKTGKKVVLTLREDASLLGGFKARIGDKVYDGSVLAQLQHIKESLLQEG